MSEKKIFSPQELWQRSAVEFTQEFEQQRQENLAAFRKNKGVIPMPSVYCTAPVEFSEDQLFDDLGKYVSWIADNRYYYKPLNREQRYLQDGQLLNGLVSL